MAEEITEIDMNKYLVIKWKDLVELKLGDYLTARNTIRDIHKKVIEKRLAEGKTENKYLVLNMDDEIDLPVLSVWLSDKDENIIEKVKVKDLAVDIVNAILLAKED